MGEKTLTAHCSAINELRACLGEEDSLSELIHNENIVTFSVQTKANKLIRFHFQSENPVAYPNSPATLLRSSSNVEEETLDLEALNTNLSHGPASLGKALSLLGRQLDVDLDWALEAVEIDGGGGESDGPEGASDGDSLDNVSESMSDQDSDLLREWSRKMIQLEAIEQEKANDVPVETDHSNKQIFDTKAAFRRLLNELEEIFKAQDINLMVDTPSAEGLYQWEVYLAGFTPEKSNLAADLYQTGRRFGLSSVHLQINFKRGLHPFYPPSVRLLSPRFKGPVLGAVASFPLLDPKIWDPISSAKDCVLNIKRFLEENAQVDLESSTQTYHPAEVLITRLSALTGIQPIDRNQSPDLVYASSLKKIKNAVSDLHHSRGYDEEELPTLVSGVEGMLDEDPFGSPTKKVRIVMSPTAEEAAAAAAAGGGEEEVEEEGATTSAGNNIEEYPIEKQEQALEPGLPEKVKQPAATAKETSAKPIAWKQGVGYGSGSNPKDKKVWDAKRAEALQDARDAELQDVLSFLLTTVEKVLTEETSMKEYDTIKNNDEEKCLVRSVLKTSCLMKFLIKELSSVGFQGMVSRSGYYRTLLEWAQLLSLDSQVAAMLLWHAEDDGNGKCLAAAVSSLKAQASTFLKALGDQAAGSSEPEDDLKLATLLLKVADLVESAVASLTMHTTSASPTAASAAQAATTAAEGDLTAPSNTNAPHDTPMIPADAPADTPATAAAAAAEHEEESEAQYVSVMSPFKVSLLPGISANHIFESDASKEPTAPSRQRARRVASELASLEADLPITASSSVCVCADEQQTILWKALITGPKGTPYEGGCFLFDIYFPSDYPGRAPSVKLRTTGGGTVRFNPNLYNCGKVCLSLLGTWQGEKGESWSAEYSSILQVLVSIQSLIFVDQPFYNEPGYESRPDDSQSNAYSAQIMEMTVKWAMIDQLKSPPEYFADAIRYHFRERGEVVVATVKRWEEWCRSIGASKSAAGIKKMLPELESEILKLKHE